MKRNLFFIVALIFSSGVLAEAQQKPRTAMYLYQSKAGDQAIAAGEHRKTFIGSPNWKQVRLVGYAYTQQAAGTTPLLEIMRPVKGGHRYYYSTDFQEANAVMKADQMYKISDYNNGQSCYVSATKKPGTIPVYLYSQPTESLQYLYIFGDKENRAFQPVAQKGGIRFEKIAFYVWEKQTDAGSVAGTAPNGEAGAPGGPGAGGQTAPGAAGSILEPALAAAKIAALDFSMPGGIYLNGAETGAVGTAAKAAAAAENAPAANHRAGLARSGGAHGGEGDL